MTRTQDSLQQTWIDCRANAIEYINTLAGEQPWLLRVSPLSPKPIAIASATGILLLAFLDAMEGLADDMRDSWLKYLQSFQRDDGLCQDPVDIKKPTQAQPNWALLAHRTRHIGWAIEELGGTFTREFEFVKKYYEPAEMEAFIDQMMNAEGEGGFWGTGNWLMDLAVCLDFQHRHFDDHNAAAAIDVYLNKMDQLQDPQTGFWFKPGDDNRRAMAGAMHIYPVYWAYGREIKHYRNAVEQTLKLQQSDGLFAYETGRGGSQCLDYDAMLVLINGCRQYEDLMPQIESAADKVLDAIMINRNEDGSFADYQIDEMKCWATKAASYSAKGGGVWETYSRLMTIAMCFEIVYKNPPQPCKPEHHMFEIFNAGKGWLGGKSALNTKKCEDD